MGFESVSKKVSFKKLTDLKVGEQLLGYVVNITDSTKIEGQKNLHMMIDGQEVLVSPAGNVRYMLKDNKIAMGLLTRITRIADKMVVGKKSTQFEVEQDRQSIYGESVAQSVVTKSTTASKIESLKVK